MARRGSCMQGARASRQEQGQIAKVSSRTKKVVNEISHCRQWHPCLADVICAQQQSGGCCHAHGLHAGRRCRLIRGRRRLLFLMHAAVGWRCRIHEPECPGRRCTRGRLMLAQAREEAQRAGGAFVLPAPAAGLRFLYRALELQAAGRESLNHASACRFGSGN